MATALGSAVVNFMQAKGREVKPRTKKTQEFFWDLIHYYCDFLRIFDGFAYFV